MRILFVGGIQQKNAAGRYYDVAPKLINGFIRNGHTVQHFADRDISRASNIFHSRKLGVGKCNKALLKVIEPFAPDLIVFKHADVIQPETLLKIRQNWPHIRMAQVNVDALFNPDNITRIQNKSGLVDANFITTYGDALKKVKLNNKPIYYIPNPVDSSIEVGKAFKAPQTQNDLFFAYGNAPEGDPRHDIPQSIIKAMPDLNFKLCIAANGTGLWGRDYMKELETSKCGLNLSRKQEKDRFAKDEDLYMYSSDRVAHYLGNGLLTFTDSSFHLNKLFREDEMVFYSSTEELIEKLKYYMQHDIQRTKIAEKGWLKSHREFSEQKVAKFIVEKTMEQDLSTYEWPTEAV